VDSGGDEMISGIWLSIFMAALYSWGFFSNRMSSIARSDEGILLLPLFLLNRKRIAALAVVNLTLALSQVALLLYILISFWFIAALVIIGWALFFMLIVQVALAIALKKIILKYLLCAVMTIAVGIRVFVS